MEKRNLTKDEIKSIIEQLGNEFPHHHETLLRQSFLHKFLDPIEKELETQKIVDHPDYIQMLTKQLVKKTRESIIQPGEAVGIICAQSIGERQTQLTLNSFHQSGISVDTVIAGVPRFLELLNTTRDPKYPISRFKILGDFKTSMDIKHFIADQLIEVQLADIILDYHFHKEKEEEIWYDSFQLIYSSRFREMKSCISLQLDIPKLFRFRVQLKRVVDRLESQFQDICCVFSPLSIGRLDIFIDVSCITMENVRSDLPSNINNENYIEIYFREIVLPKLISLPICGIRNIHDYSIHKNSQGHWEIVTLGNNCKELFHLSFVDISSFRTNDMWEVFEIVGIEGVREFLIQEFISIVSADGTYINRSHIVLLVDIMTYHGVPNSISRYGMKKEGTSVLSRSSFEESLEHFCNAAFFSEKEPVQSVSASIMCGKRSNIGSGVCKMIMDLSQLKKYS
jgi:DNA-directed RNA polymerase subunit A"